MDNHRSFRRYNRGFDIDWATCGEDALKIAKKKKYDLAILDVKMPRMNGFIVKGKLEKNNPNMKFIFLTGHGLSDDFDAPKNKILFYLAKPIQIEILIQKIETALKK